MSTQLKRDLAQRINERLRQACRDHIELCQIADLSPEEGLSIMFAAIGSFLTKGMATLSTITPEQWGETMTETMRMARSEKRASQ